MPASVVYDLKSPLIADLALLVDHPLLGSYQLSNISDRIRHDDVRSESAAALGLGPARYTRGVVDFVAVKAQAIHKDQQGRNRDSAPFIPKHLETTNFNRLQ